ncbi:hypothetical protein [Frankia sp. CcWB2]
MFGNRGRRAGSGSVGRRGYAGRWCSAERLVPGAAEHQGFHLKDFHLDIQVAADGRFAGVHTSYITDGRSATDLSPAGLRYRRSHVANGRAHGVLDHGRGTGEIMLEGYGAAGLRVHHEPGRLVLHLDTALIAAAPALYTRAVLLPVG